LTRKGIASLILVVLLLLISSVIVAYKVEYTVVEGDTLWRIARAHGIEWEDLAKFNAITDEFSLQIGTVLKIPYGYTEKFVLISNDDHEIPAVVTVPIGEGGFPVVVMLHGTGSDKDEAGGGYLIAAPALARAGIASIRFDFMGNGESTADYIDYNFTSAVSDTNAALNYAAGLAEIDGTRAGVMGWSQGGTIAILAAGQEPIFKSVVCWAGAPDLTLIGTPEAYEIAKEQGYYELTFAWRSSLRLGLQWFDEVYNTDVLEVLSSSAAPVLAISGSEDTVVVPENSYRIVEASRNEASEVLIIEGADHTFNIFTGDMTAFHELVEATVNWFKETL